MVTVEPAKNVAAFLQRLDTNFAPFARAFNEGQYVLWLGSGISRDRVPNVGELVEKVLEHLRKNIDPTDAQCEFRRALDDALRLASLTTAEQGSLDFSLPVDTWALRERIIAPLVSSYAKVLDVPVGASRPEDYLVWTALDAPRTYGAPDLEPDVEHYGIAILALEGVAPTAVTANWDGLLERALAELTPAFTDRVRVAVAPEDFRGPPQPITLIKFHGCAVRALGDETGYRSMLIARDSQISGWTVQPEHQLMKQHLEVLYSSGLTLMIGLSAQDPNLQTVFGTAVQHLSRQWPSSPPALVLSELAIEAHHRTVLRLTYGANHSSNATDIADSALLGAYGKTTILGLVISTLTQKLSFLLDREVSASWGSTASSPLQMGLNKIRDAIATCADPVDAGGLDYGEVIEYQREFVKGFIRQVNFVLRVFRYGAIPDLEELSYEPLSERPIAQTVHNPDFPDRQFGRLSVVLALVGLGLGADWEAEVGDSSSPDQAVALLKTTNSSTRLHFVKNGVALTKLELDEAFDEGGNVLIVVAEEEPVATTRSPKARYGRDGRFTRGRFNIAAAMNETDTVEDLYEAFKLAGGL